MNYSVILPTLNEKNHITNLIDEISDIFILNKKPLLFIFTCNE